MKKTLVTLTTALFALSATAQELPVPSPLGEVEQKVGLTKVEIEYSRPSAKGRTIAASATIQRAILRFIFCPFGVCFPDHGKHLIVIHAGAQRSAGHPCARPAPREAVFQR